MEKTLSDGSVQACVGADSAMVGEEVEELRALRSALSPPHFYDGDLNRNVSPCFGLLLVPWDLFFRLELYTVGLMSPSGIVAMVLNQFLATLKSAVGRGRKGSGSKRCSGWRIGQRNRSARELGIPRNCGYRWYQDMCIIRLYKLSRLLPGEYIRKEKHVGVVFCRARTPYFG